jgi:hypothetical protein
VALAAAAEEVAAQRTHRGAYQSPYSAAALRAAAVVKRR